MDVDELRSAVDVAGRGAELAVSVVEPVDRSCRWTTCSTKRGAILDQRFFDPESAACEFVLARLDHDLCSAGAAPRAELTADALARARADAAEQDRRSRAALGARGLDPVTGRPAPDAST